MAVAPVHASLQAHSQIERVLGWDVLRGLCALAVALYHLLYWQDIAAIHTLGSYGVYLFFVLSGASLAYTYSGRLRRGGDYAAFLLTRWLRLAPLYILLCLVFIVMLSIRSGAWVDQLPLRLALNASFAFGADDPVIWALLVGGWSLGIEFAYYLAFPVLLVALSRRSLWIALGLALCLLQWTWIYQTAGSEAGYADSAVAYHHVPAFAAYFFGGCLIGQWRRRGDWRMPSGGGLLAWLSMLALLLWLNPDRQGDELLGVRGVVLFGACFALVWASGHTVIPAKLAGVARTLGDITYGCYLLHPLFFFGLAWFVLPLFGVDDVAQAPLAFRCTLVAAVLVLSCATAAASERWFEAPLRRWGKKTLWTRVGPKPAGYSDAASISS
jgi:peptidoglycan/LPS O-acetylase OafA/YrhL